MKGIQYKKGEIILRKIVLLFASFSLILILAACGSSDFNYKVVEENKNKAGQLYLRITTDVSKKDDLKTLAEQVAREKDDGKLDSIFIFIHKEAGKNDKKFGENMATAKEAYTNKGQAQTGLDDKLSLIHI